MSDYRIDVHIRRRKEPPFDFVEFKSELYEDFDDLKKDIADFIEQTIFDDMEGRDGSNDDE